MTTSGLASYENKSRRNLMDVALGKAPADLAVVGASVLNVFTGELLDNHAICVKGDRIAYVGPNPEEMISDRTRVINADGRCVIPGFIDGHAHIAWSYPPAGFLAHAMAGGTTALVTETFEAYFAAGYDGVVDFLAACRDQPIKIYATAPAMVSISRAARGIDPDDLEKLLRRDDILGMGESYWQGVVQSPDHFLPAFARVRGARKALEGHTAGANEKKLAAYVAAGISSCHEPIKADEALSRLRQGLYVMIREGSIRRDLAAVSAIRNMGVDLRRMVLVTDGVSPDELMEDGYMEFVVQKAIACGFDPVTAIRMATLNVAEHFSLSGDIGAIAPGRYADLVIIPDLATIRAELVISNGRVIAENGKSLIAATPYGFSAASRNSIALPSPFSAADFRIMPPNESLVQTVRAIEMVTDLVTRETMLEMPVMEGELRSDPEADIIKVAAIDRRINPGKRFVGFIKGFGMKTGALASSGAWDCSDIIVAGADDDDMAVAVNRIRETQGGIVAVKAGRIIAELPLPVFGVISDLSLAEIADRTRDLKAAAAGLGVPFPDPTLTVITLTGAAIPYLRICEEGYVNLKDGRTMGLFD